MKRLLALTLAASLTLTLAGLSLLSGGSLGKEHSHCQGERCRQTDESCFRRHIVFLSK